MQVERVTDGAAAGREAADGFGEGEPVWFLAECGEGEFPAVLRGGSVREAAETAGGKAAEHEVVAGEGGEPAVAVVDEGRGERGCAVAGFVS